jgi:putative transposase
MPRIRLVYHVTWSTKYRKSQINDLNKELIIRSIISKSSDLQVKVLAINAVEDHIHVLLSCPATIAPCIVIGQIKGVSSHLIRRRGWSDFRWQKEYSLRAVSEDQIPKVMQYIQAQGKHHIQTGKNQDQ